MGVQIGEKYGRLTVLDNTQGCYKILCKCDCGVIKTYQSGNLKSGATRSCGCLKNLGNNLKHGDRHTRLYKIWKAMRERCNTKSCSAYKNYGARGIKVCSEWNDYLTFKEWALSSGYTDELTIDRINVNDNYEPSNCRWATYKNQANNTRHNHFVTFNNETKTISEWADILGVKPHLILNRIRRGWSVEDALFLPANSTKSYKKLRGINEDNRG